MNLEKENKEKIHFLSSQIEMLDELLNVGGHVTLRDLRRKKQQKIEELQSLIRKEY